MVLSSKDNYAIYLKRRSPCYFMCIKQTHPKRR